jgi:LacI family transcriptional regulator
MTEAKRSKGTLTIYDVARLAGVSIASVSRVLNGQGTPRPETRERVMRAVGELSFVPDAAARALSNGLKEVVGIVFRRGGEATFEDEDESLLFIDGINRGVEVAAQRRSYDVLVSSVGVHDSHAAARVAGVAGKSDGIILHDRMLSAVGIARLSEMIPVVTLAGSPTRSSINVGCDNDAGMRALVNHLTGDHGYRHLAYLSGHADSPDNRARARVFEAAATAVGAQIQTGPAWQGNYSASGGAQVITSLLAHGGKLPRAIVCANDQTALGVIHALARSGVRVPGDVAVTGFDDVPVARHLHPSLTTIRQPIEQMGATAFEVLYSRIGGQGGESNIVLPVRLMLRESCGCGPALAPSAAAAPGGEV